MPNKKILYRNDQKENIEKVTTLYACPKLVYGHGPCLYYTNVSDARAWCSYGACDFQFNKCVDGMQYSG